MTRRIHNPLFIWDPRSGIAGERRQALVQTIDFGPPLLEFFGIEATPDMQGVPVARTIVADAPLREYGLFGSFGSHVCVTDGRHVHMHASATPANQPLYEHTLMPTHMRGFFTTAELGTAEVAEPSRFHPPKGFALCVRRRAPPLSRYAFGTLLFDLDEDPAQLAPLQDSALELRIATALRDLLVAPDAPSSQFIRPGLPAPGPLTNEHLVAANSGLWSNLPSCRRPAPRTSVTQDAR